MLLRNLAILASSALLVFAAAETAPASGSLAACPGYTKWPQVNFAQILKTDPQSVQNEDQITAFEDIFLEVANQSGMTNLEEKQALGGILVFDRNLSVNRNQACFSCHTPGAGFTGGISALNTTTATFPGSVQIRTGNRKPPSAAYAAFSPVLYYSPSIQDARLKTNAENSEANFIGGTFVDGRATGLVTGSPAGDQAMGPPTNPLEMALPDHACAIYRISQGSYANVFRAAWGVASLNITWPANASAVCNTPNEGAANQQPLALATADRALAEKDYISMAQSIAAFELTSFVSPFSSKYDAYLAGAAQLTTQESLGLQLFNGKAQCNACHLSLGSKPLFNDFTFNNIGTPANPNNPYRYENANNGSGLIANPAGPSYVDDGLGAFLAGSLNTNKDWKALAPQYMGAYQTATLRNVAAVPAAGFKRAYTHNGYFTDLPTLVHFYNTRDILPQCKTASQKVGVNCWPAPEEPANVNTLQTGNLGLTAAEEAAIVAFLNTLTDGYFNP